METDTKKLADSLDALQRDFAEFRSHYLIVNERYSQSLATLKGLTSNAKTAAMRAAAAAKHALEATNKAFEAVKDAANQSLQSIVRDAADAAWASAEAVTLSRKAAVLASLTVEKKTGG